MELIVQYIHQILDWDLGKMKLPFFGLLLLDTDQEQPKKDAFWK